MAENQKVFLIAASIYFYSSKCQNLVEEKNHIEPHRLFAPLPSYKDRIECTVKIERAVICKLYRASEIIR